MRLRNGQRFVPPPPATVPPGPPIHWGGPHREKAGDTDSVCTDGACFGPRPGCMTMARRVQRGSFGATTSRLVTTRIVLDGGGKPGREMVEAFKQREAGCCSAVSVVPPRSSHVERQAVRTLGKWKLCRRCMLRTVAACILLRHEAGIQRPIAALDQVGAANAGDSARLHLTSLP